MPEATFGVIEMEIAWLKYQEYIRRAKLAISGPGLFIEIHGQTHPERWIELGYLLSSATLNSNRVYSTYSSIKNLANRFRRTSFDSLLRGPHSFGGLLQMQGYRVVPSPANRSPRGGRYFKGGYNTLIHGSRNGGQVDAIQIEAPSHLRNSAAGSRFAMKLAFVVRDFIRKYYR